MGLLVNGVWHDEQPSERTAGGRFVRPTTRSPQLGDRRRRPGCVRGSRLCGGTRALSSLCLVACPWAHRTFILRKLKGLEEAARHRGRAGPRSARLGVPQQPRTIAEA